MGWSFSHALSTLTSRKVLEGGHLEEAPSIAAIRVASAVGAKGSCNLVLGRSEARRAPQASSQAVHMPLRHLYPISPSHSPCTGSTSCAVC
jgi:hypothetical protein